MLCTPSSSSFPPISKKQQWLLSSKVSLKYTGPLHQEVTFRKTFDYPERQKVMSAKGSLSSLLNQSDQLPCFYFLRWKCFDIFYTNWNCIIASTVHPYQVFLSGMHYSVYANFTLLLTHKWIKYLMWLICSMCLIDLLTVCMYMYILVWVLQSFISKYIVFTLQENGYGYFVFAVISLKWKKYVRLNKGWRGGGDYFRQIVVLLQSLHEQSQTGLI